MSEKVTKTVEKDETTKKPAATAKKAAEKTDKKDNWVKRTGRKIKKGMSDHPFWTAFGGAAAGSAATVGIGYAGKKLLNKRRENRNVCIPDENPLDPNL